MIRPATRTGRRATVHSGTGRAGSAQASLAARGARHRRAPNAEPPRDPRCSLALRDVGTGPHTIARVPYTLRNLREDLEDVGSNFDGPPDLEFRLATKAL